MKLFLMKETTSTRETREEETATFALRKLVVSMRVEPATGLLGSCCRASRRTGRATALAIRKGCVAAQAAPSTQAALTVRAPSRRPRHAGHGCSSRSRAGRRARSPALACWPNDELLVGLESRLHKLFNNHLFTSKGYGTKELWLFFLWSELSRSVLDGLLVRSSWFDCCSSSPRREASSYLCFYLSTTKVQHLGSIIFSCRLKLISARSEFTSFRSSLHNYA